MLSILAYVAGLLGTLALIASVPMYILVALSNRRPPCSLRLAAGILGGYLAGVLFVWAVLPREWTLPFWTTLAASVNAAKYGHPVEHYAQGVVVAMLFCGVVGAAIGGLLTHFAGVLVRQHGIRHVH